GYFTSLAGPLRLNGPAAPGSRDEAAAIVAGPSEPCSLRRALELVFLFPCDGISRAVPEPQPTKTCWLASGRGRDDESNLFHLPARRHSAVAVVSALPYLETHRAELAITAEHIFLALAETALNVCVCTCRTERLAFERWSILDCDWHIDFLTTKQHLLIRS